MVVAPNKTLPNKCWRWKLRQSTNESLQVIWKMKSGSCLVRIRWELYVYHVKHLNLISVDNFTLQLILCPDDFFSIFHRKLQLLAKEMLFNFSTCSTGIDIIYSFLEKKTNSFIIIIEPKVPKVLVQIPLKFHYANKLMLDEFSRLVQRDSERASTYYIIIRNVIAKFHHIF